MGSDRGQSNPRRLVVIGVAEGSMEFIRSHFSRKDEFPTAAVGYGQAISEIRRVKPGVVVIGLDQNYAAAIRIIPVAKSISPTTKVVVAAFSIDDSRLKNAVRVGNASLIRLPDPSRAGQSAPAPVARKRSTGRTLAPRDQRRNKPARTAPAGVKLPARPAAVLMAPPPPLIPPPGLKAETPAPPKAPQKRKGTRPAESARKAASPAPTPRRPRSVPLASGPWSGPNTGRGGRSLFA